MSEFLGELARGEVGIFSNKICCDFVWFLFELFPKKETTHLARKKEQAFDLVVHTIYHELRFVYRFIYRKRADEAALHEYAKT